MASVDRRRHLEIIPGGSWGGRVLAYSNVVWRVQTYRNIMYLLLSVPLGLIYAGLLFFGLLFSISAIPIFIGFPLLLLLLATCWRIAGFERTMAIEWLGVTIPPMSYPGRTRASRLTQLREHLRNPITWKSLAYLAVKFPFSMLSLALMAILGFLSVGITVQPLGYLLGTIVVNHDPRLHYRAHILNVPLTGQFSPFAFAELVVVGLLGICIGIVALHAINGLAYAWGQFARWTLGLSPTALRLAEAQAVARRASAQAERAERSRQELIVNVSHELRTPIASIRGHVESLLMATDDSRLGVVEQRNYLRIVHRETERLNALVDDLLSLARAEADELRLEIVPVSAGEVVEEVYSALAPLATRERHITIVRDVPPGLPLVLADQQRLTQIVLNLVRNAITYTPTGGLVSLALAPADPGYVALTVADTGMGIAPEDQERIFERFYRTDASRARATGGFGLGLSIVRDLITSMGGTVTVESKVGEGTCFTVRLRTAHLV